MPWLLLPLLALAGPLVSPGEVLGGLEVRAVEEHPEYVRLRLALEDGRELPVELTRGEGGACAHHGHRVQPRWELLGEARELEDQPPAIAALCARLAAEGAALDLRPPGGARPPGGSGAPPAEAAWTHPGPHSPAPPLGALGLAWLALGALGLLGLATAGRRAWRALDRPARAELLAVAALGLGARLALSPRGILWGPFFGYGRLTEAWGADLPHPLYGGGFAALMGPLSRAAGYAPEALYGANLTLSALAPPMAWATARLLAPGARAGPLVAGLGLALLPAHLRLAGSEVMHVSLATVELLAVLGTLAFLRGGGLAWALAGALAAGLAVHVRPEALPFVAVPAALAAAGAVGRQRRVVAVGALVVSGLVGWRLLDLVLSPGQSAVDYTKLGTAGFLYDALLPSASTPGARSHTHTLLQLRLTPPWVPVLAALALASSRHRRVAAGLLAWWALTALPVLPKSWPLADALRLQAPTFAPALLMAGLGAQALAERGAPWLGRALPAGVLALALPYLPGVAAPWAVTEEHRLLREVLPTLPEGAVVLYDDAGPHHDAFGRWASFMSPGVRWVGISRLDEVRGQPLMAFLGTSCHLTRPARGQRDFGPLPSACPALRRRCALRPWRTRGVSTRTDVDVALRSPPEVGLYTVEDCGASPDERR